ncbi:hypothetical protein V8C34DRAFT_285130, partial [Trichoderma compactum]
MTARTKVCDVLMMERFLNSFAAFLVWVLSASGVSLRCDVILGTGAMGGLWLGSFLLGLRGREGFCCRFSPCSFFLFFCSLNKDSFGALDFWLLSPPFFVLRYLGVACSTETCSFGNEAIRSLRI